MATTTKKPQQQSGYDIVVTTAFELIGVGLLSLIAGISAQVGKVVVIVMTGFLIVWLLANTDFLTKYLGQPETSNFSINKVFAPFIGKS